MRKLTQPQRGRSNFIRGTGLQLSRVVGLHRCLVGVDIASIHEHGTGIDDPGQLPAAHRVQQLLHGQPPHLVGVLNHAEGNRAVPYALEVVFQTDSQGFRNSRDIAEAPLVDARQRATCLGVRASFERGEFERTGLANASVDAVMSVDALLFAPDKAAAFGELRRVLRSGGRLALTSWDYWRQPAGRPPQVQDHRPIAQAAGFTILTYEETPGWRDILERTGVAMLAAAAELAAESGEPVEVVRSLLIEENATIDAMSRRIFLVAEATE